jgi:hypothetical protein
LIGQRISCGVPDRASATRAPDGIPTRRAQPRFENCVIVAARARRYLRAVDRVSEGAMKKAERWFYPGERVQVFYKSVGEWKDGIIRSMIRLPKQRSPNPSFYQVTVDGKENPRYYRPRELKPAVRAAAKPRRRAAPRSGATSR